MNKSKRDDRSTTATDQEKISIEAQVRTRIHDWIMEMIDEELESALNASPGERTGKRCGYRNGSRSRTLTFGVGHYELRVPRGYLFKKEGGKKEWRSALIPRYRRRTEEVEKAIIEAYLCGSNTRKIKRVLTPFLKGASLSRTTISRIVERLRTSFQQWRERSLKKEDIVIVFLDGIVLKIRVAGKVQNIPLLVALGVRSDGTKVLLYFESACTESKESWRQILTQLKGRGLGEPLLVVSDGGKGVCAVVPEEFPHADHQRCTVHKLRNLLVYVPQRLKEELKEDYQRIIYAVNKATAQAEYKRFCDKWKRREPRVVSSLEEAGDQLMTFFDYPEKCWRSLHSTNIIERLNGEFRRRVKTQNSLPTRESAEIVLYGMLAEGLIMLNHIRGHRELAEYVRLRRQYQKEKKGVEAVA
jgi:putative transposase